MTPLTCVYWTEWLSFEDPLFPSIPVWGSHSLHYRIRFPILITPLSLLPSEMKHTPVGATHKVTLLSKDQCFFFFFFLLSVYNWLMLNISMFINQTEWARCITERRFMNGLRGEEITSFGMCCPPSESTSVSKLSNINIWQSQMLPMVSSGIKDFIHLFWFTFHLFYKLHILRNPNRIFKWKHYKICLLEYYIMGDLKLP